MLIISQEKISQKRHNRYLQHYHPDELAQKLRLARFVAENVHGQKRARRAADERKDKERAFPRTACSGDGEPFVRAEDREGDDGNEENISDQDKEWQWNCSEQSFHTS